MSVPTGIPLLPGVVRSGEASHQPIVASLSRPTTGVFLPSHGLHQITSSRYLLSFLSKPRRTYLLTVDHCDSFNGLKALVGLINVDIELRIFNTGAF